MVSWTHERQECSIPDCGDPHYCRGWCIKHYRRWQRSGDPLKGTRLSALERLWANVEKTAGCWYWLGSVHETGYGYIGVNGKNRIVHRFAWEVLVGPIPKGLTIDHVKANGCTSRVCVKALADEYGPAHLEPVTRRENILRGDTFSGVNARKMHCPQGHPYAGDNLYVSPQGRRNCRACTRQRHRERRARASRRSEQSV